VVSGVVDFNDLSDITLTPTIPANHVITKVEATVNTAFNNCAVGSIDVGTTAGGTQLANDLLGGQLGTVNRYGYCLMNTTACPYNSTTSTSGTGGTALNNFRTSTVTVHVDVDTCSPAPTTGEVHVQVYYTIVDA